MAIVDKQVAFQNKVQHHIKLKYGDVGDYVLLPGDPFRTDKVAALLDDAQLMAHSREHKTYTGYYKGVRVSVTSTGMGCPSTAIAAEELIKVGAKCMIRIGTSPGLRPETKGGDVFISKGVVKKGGLARNYVPDEFPAVPDMALTYEMVQTANEMMAGTENKVRTGINSCNDAIYGESEKFIQDLMDRNVEFMEMESAALFTVATCRGAKAACICSSGGYIYREGGQDNDGETPEHEEARIKKMIEIALETFYRYDQKLKNGELID